MKCEINLYFCIQSQEIFVRIDIWFVTAGKSEDVASDVNDNCLYLICKKVLNVTLLQIYLLGMVEP